MQPETRHVDIRNRTGSIQPCENVTQFHHVFAHHAARVIVFVKAFQPLVAERPDHSSTVMRYVTNVNSAKASWTPDSRSQAIAEDVWQGAVEEITGHCQSTPPAWYDSHSRGPLVRGARDWKEGIQTETPFAGLRHEKQTKATNKIRSLH